MDIDTPCRYRESVAHGQGYLLSCGGELARRLMPQLIRLSRCRRQAGGIGAGKMDGGTKSDNGQGKVRSAAWHVQDNILGCEAFVLRRTPVCPQTGRGACPERGAKKNPYPTLYSSYFMAT